jgi:hypothetical protein
LARLCWNLRLVIELWYLEGFWFLLEDFFWKFYFCMVKYLNFHNSSFAFKILFNVNLSSSSKNQIWFQFEFYLIRTRTIIYTVIFFQIKKESKKKLEKILVGEYLFFLTYYLL